MSAVCEQGLFQRLYGGLNQGYLNIWGKRELNGERKSASHWYALSYAAGIAKAMQQAQTLDAQGWDVYFGVCPAANEKQGNT